MKRRWEEAAKIARRGQRREEEKYIKINEAKDRESQKKEGAGAQQGRKGAVCCLFPMICGPGGSKSRLAKAAGAEPSG